MSEKSSPLFLVLVALAIALGVGFFFLRSTPIQPLQSSGTATTQFEDAEPGLPVLVRLDAFELVDQDGEAFGSDQLLGRPWIANFIFTSCQGTCPIQSGKLAGLLETIAGDPLLEDVQAVSFSVDPVTDTPEVLSAYAAEYEADLERWTFLTGTRERIWELSEKSFKLAVGEAPENADMPLFHSTTMVLVDRAGNIRGFAEGTSEEGIAEILGWLSEIIDERPSGSELDVAYDSSVVPVPADVLAPAWMAPRAQAQIATAEAFTVRHDFGFVDRIDESGITFTHRIVDDAGKSYKAVHYDHGNSVAVADIDGDDLLDLYFTTQIGANQLWRNLGGGKFEDVTARAGVEVADSVGVAAAFADIDGDGDADLFTTTVMGGNRLFENDGSGRFTDISKAAGVDHAAHSSGAAFFDYDKDGDLDLVVTNVGQYTSDTIHEVVGGTAPGDDGRYTFREGFADGFSGHLKPERTETSLLYRNDGSGRFEEVSDELGFIDGSWSGDLAVIDADDDGWLDIYLLSMQGNDSLFRNKEGEGFERVTDSYFDKTPWGAMGAEVLDVDGDGRLDLYLTDMHSDMWEVGEDFDVVREKDDPGKGSIPGENYLKSSGKSIFGNALYLHKEDGSWAEVSDQHNAETYWPWGLSAGDVNADGWSDVFVINSMSYPFRYTVNSLLLNDHGYFRESEFILGVEPRKDGRTAMPVFDIDCGGADAEHKDCGGANSSRTVWGALGSRSSAFVDLDNDGDLDIVTLEMGAAPMVLVSNLADEHEIHWLGIELRGTESNRDGLGALVSLEVDGRTLVQRNDGKSGYLAQSRMPLYFGLGEAEVVSAIEIRWPSGVVQKLEDVAANQTLEVVEGS